MTHEVEFNHKNGEYSRRTVVVEQLEKCVLNISSFVAIQLLAGSALDADKYESNGNVPYPIYKLMTHIMGTLFSSTAGFDMKIDRKDLIIMKDWIVSRMKHCEEEKANGSDRFNPDTYIGQKLLLLEILQALSVIVIEDY